MWWEMREEISFKEFGELGDDSIVSSRRSTWSDCCDIVSGGLGRGILGDSYDALFIYILWHAAPELGRFHGGRLRIESD